MVAPESCLRSRINRSPFSNKHAETHAHVCLTVTMVNGMLKPPAALLDFHDLFSKCTFVFEEIQNFGSDRVLGMQLTKRRCFGERYHTVRFREKKRPMLQTKYKFWHISNKI